MGANMSDESPSYSDDEDCMSLDENFESYSDGEDMSFTYSQDDAEVVSAEKEAGVEDATTAKEASKQAELMVEQKTSESMDMQASAEDKSTHDDEVRQKERVSSSPPEPRGRFRYRRLGSKKKIIDTSSHSGRVRSRDTVGMYIPGISTSLAPPKPKKEEEKPPEPIENGEYRQSEG